MKGTLTKRTNQGKKQALDCCHRCGGLKASDLATITGMVEWRCVLCGERVDQVILAHRQHREALQEGEQLFAGSGRASLN